jgi:hypothetical protein
MVAAAADFRNPLQAVASARDAMPQGGKLTIETQNTFLDAPATRSHGA